MFKQLSSIKTIKNLIYTRDTVDAFPIPPLASTRQCNGSKMIVAHFIYVKGKKKSVFFIVILYLFLSKLKIVAVSDRLVIQINILFFKKYNYFSPSQKTNSTNGYHLIFLNSSSWDREGPKQTEWFLGSELPEQDLPSVPPEPTCSCPTDNVMQNTRNIKTTFLTKIRKHIKMWPLGWGELGRSGVAGGEDKNSNSFIIVFPRYSFLTFLQIHGSGSFYPQFLEYRVGSFFYRANTLPLP